MARYPGTTTSKTHNNVYKTWVNKRIITNSEPETIFKKRAAIVKFIERPDGYTDGTRKQHYLSLANSMKLLNKMKVADVYVEKATALNNKQEEKYKTNQRTDKQHLASNWEEMLAKYNQLSAVDNPDRMTTQQKLLTGLNVYQPPLRSEPSNMKIEADKEKSDGNAVVKRNGQWYYYLTNYKTKNTYGDKYIKLSKKASSILDESLKELPREWLYVNARGKPIGKQGYAALIKKTLGQADSVNTLRSAYASHALSEGDMTEAQKEVVASSMATSVDRLDTVYRKVDDEQAADIDEVTDKVSEYTPKPRGRPKGGAATDRKQYAKEYYEKNKGKRQGNNAQYFQENKREIYKRQVEKRIAAGCNVSDATKEKYGLL
jgi:hypothetical protein